MAESNETRGLSCSVCYNHFKSDEVQFVPRNLNCGHTYCTGKNLSNFLYDCFAHLWSDWDYLCSANRAKFDKQRINAHREFSSLLLPLCDICGYFCVHIIFAEPKTLNRLLVVKDSELLLTRSDFSHMFVCCKQRDAKKRSQRKDHLI